MKASAERLRWIVAAAAVLLLIVLCVFLGYGRYRALRNWQGILARSGIHITHETDGYTFSQSVKGRTIFTLHAAKAVQIGDGKWALHDAVLTLFGKTGNTVDHVHGAEFEYDEKTGVARALGEVLMDIEAPVSAGKSQVAGATPTDNVIHVRTSGLVYLRKLAVAATDQEAEFRYGDMQCLSRGAEFDTGENILRLLADVRLNGQLHGEPVMLHAAKADLNRQTNTIALVQPVAELRGQTVRAANAVVDLRTDGSIQSGQADGAVTLDSGTRHLAAAHAEGTFSKTSGPQSVRLAGGVTLVDSKAGRPMRGHAQVVDTTFNTADAPTLVVATGGADLGMSEQRSGMPSLARALHGDRIVVTLLPVGHSTSSQVSEVQAHGAAIASGDSMVAGRDAAKTPAMKSMQVSADNLRAVFDTGVKHETALQQLLAEGHTRLHQKGPAVAEQTSTGDSLDVKFAPQRAGTPNETQVASAVQIGHVQVHNVAAAHPPAEGLVLSDGSADKATYEALTDQLTLSGQARFSQAGTLLTAASIAVEQHLGDVDATGDVLATLQDDKSHSTSASARATHVSADHAHLSHAAGLEAFFGTESLPARLWQDASQVTAASLLFDQNKRTLAARPAAAGGLVHATFASDSQSKEKQKTGKKEDKDKASQVLRVTSAAMDYADAGSEATFRGEVHMDGVTGQARSQRAVVFLDPPPAKDDKPKSALTDASPFGGLLDHVVLTEDVRLDQPGRVGTGEELLYKAADSTYVLTGSATKPARMVDAQQGNVTGATLLFKQDDNTIIVAGAPPVTPQSKRGRVRSETEVPSAPQARSDTK